MKTIMNSNSRYNTTAKELTEKSHVFEQTRCHTISSNNSQVVKESLFHKNITAFRDSFHAGDHRVLPFLASLRNIKDYRKEYSFFFT